MSKDNGNTHVQSEAVTAATDANRALLHITKAERMTLEQWLDYGAALKRGRACFESTRKFGDWVREHKLDRDVAKASATRSNAMRLAEHRADLKALNVTSGNPTYVIQQLRKRGVPWALSTKPRRAARGLRERGVAIGMPEVEAALKDSRTVIEALGDDVVYPERQFGEFMRELIPVVQKRWSAREIATWATKLTARQSAQVGTGAARLSLVARSPPKLGMSITSMASRKGVKPVPAAVNGTRTRGARSHP